MARNITPVHTLLPDWEERYAPASGVVLQVSAVDDIIFLRLGKLEETHETTTFTETESIAVRALPLALALSAHVPGLSIIMDQVATAPDPAYAPQGAELSD